MIMDIAAIASAQEGAKALISLAKGAISASADQQVKGRLIEIQQAILEVQEKLNDAQAERFTLLGQVAELREKLRTVEDRKAALDAYELSEVEPGKRLMKTKPGHAHEHYACPKCYSGGAVGLIQAVGVNGRTCWCCSSCDFKLFTGKSNPPSQPRRSASSYSAAKW